MTAEEEYDRLLRHGQLMSVDEYRATLEYVIDKLCAEQREICADAIECYPSERERIRNAKQPKTRG